MTLTNPLTIALHWLQVLFWATLIGAAALRTLGYTLHSWVICCSAGLLGFLIAGWLFPRGWWDLAFITPVPGYNLITGYCAALVLPGLYRLADWYGARRLESNGPAAP